MVNIYKGIFVFALFFFVVSSSYVIAKSTDYATSPSSFYDDSGQEITLWGVNVVDGMDASLYLRGKIALNDLINDGNVRCEAQGDRYFCKNSKNIDIGLSMVQMGYLTVDRRSVDRTALEVLYLQAQDNAYKQGQGVWAGVLTVTDESPTFPLLPWGFYTLIACGLMLAIMVLLYIPMSRRLARLERVLKETSNLVVRKSNVEQQERVILAAMLEAELRSNKTKTDAFLIIYGEQLNKLRNAKNPPTYRRAGDVIHKTPSLQRAAFDRAADRLNILGGALAKKVSEFYENVSTESEYIDLTPEMPMSQAISLIEEAISNCKKMDTQIKKLIPDLEKISQSRTLADS